MRLRLWIGSVLGCLTAVNAWAGELEVTLSDESAWVQYTAPISYEDYGRTAVDMGLLYTESDDWLVSLGIGMEGEVGSQAPGLEFGLGVRGYAGRVDDDYDVSAITLGLLGKFVPPAFSRLGVLAHVNYAPSITAYGDAERFTDAGVRLEYEVLPVASAYLGYRQVEVEVDRDNKSDVELDETVYVGISLSF